MYSFKNKVGGGNGPLWEKYTESYSNNELTGVVTWGLHTLYVWRGSNSKQVLCLEFRLQLHVIQNKAKKAKRWETNNLTIKNHINFTYILKKCYSNFFRPLLLQNSRTDKNDWRRPVQWWQKPAAY